MDRVFLRPWIALVFCLMCAPFAWAQSMDNTAPEIQSAPAGIQVRTRAELRAELVAQAVKGIISYVRWPTPNQTSQLCVVGPTEYADALIVSEQMYSSESYTMHVRRVLLSDISTDGQDSCASVYIGELDRVDQISLLKKLVGKPILSISENLTECNNGSLFCLHIADDKVGFEVNLDSVARSGLRVNPQVLKLGRATGANG